VEETLGSSRRRVQISTPRVDRGAPDDRRRRLATHAENGNGAANGSEGSSGSERQRQRRRQARV